MYTYLNNTPVSPRNCQSYSRGGSPNTSYAAGIHPAQVTANPAYMQTPYHGQQISGPQHQIQPDFTVHDLTPRNAIPRVSPSHTTPPLLGQPGWDPNAQYYYISPASSGCRDSPQDPSVLDPTLSVPHSKHARNISLPAMPTDGAHSQIPQSLHPATALTAEDIARYSYPTNRSFPTGLGGQPLPAAVAASAHLMPLPESHQPLPLPYQSVNFAPRTRSREASPNYLLGNSSEFPTPESVQSASFAPTLLNYLSMPGPMIDPRLVAGEITKNLKQMHSWFDVRNIRHWDDFTLSSILGNSQVKQVLSIASTLPTPIAPSAHGTSNKDLLIATASNLCVRVNKALLLAQGQPHLAIRLLDDGGHSHFQADFVSSYQDDNDYTIFGDGRGRVVGILKPSNLWQSRWKRGSVYEQKKYLAGMSDLHQAMRDHSCRYGFMVTESELICARYRTRSSNSKTPYFGSLELSESIPMSVSPNQSTQQGPQLTAALALFYLHMLAKKGGLDGQLHWKLEVGRPEDCTRHTYEKRDSWMPEILKEDERKMKNVRGWTYPKDKLNKKERELGRSAKTNRRRR